jgi:hypothetical protein
MKKCPICYSILPPKVVFCPVCGTELQTQVSESANVVHTPVSNPVRKPFFGDEPIETAMNKAEVIIDSTQYAWKISDVMIPFQMKGQVKYSDDFSLSRFKLRFMNQMKISDLFIISSLSLIVAFLLLFQISTISLMIFYNSISFLVPLSLLMISLAISSIALFILNQKTAKIIAEKNEIKLNCTKKNVLPFLFIHGLHLIMVGLVSCIIFFMIRNSILSETLPPSIYAFAFLLILILSLISPTFRIAKILASIRDSGVFQTLYDSIQFPKISIKRNLEISVLTFLIPLSIILASLNPLLKFAGNIFNSSNHNPLNSIDIFIFSSVLLVIAASFIFFSLNDIRATLHYEKIIQQYIDPPSLEWINSNQDDFNSDYRIQARHPNDDFQKTSFSNREMRCPTCSAIIVEGAEFCTDCGKKVVI